jgi:hypothetical protein
MKRLVALILLAACICTALNSCKKECEHEIKRLPGKEATCSSVGWYDYELCTKCGYNTYAEIAKKEHELSTQPGKFRTCTETGWDNYEACKNCDYNEKVVKAPLGHLYKDGVCQRCDAPEGLDSPIVGVD